jgi:hypothetical protein
VASSGANRSAIHYDFKFRLYAHIILCLYFLYLSYYLHLYLINLLRKWGQDFYIWSRADLTGVKFSKLLTYLVLSVSEQNLNLLHAVALWLVNYLEKKIDIMENYRKSLMRLRSRKSYISKLSENCTMNKVDYVSTLHLAIIVTDFFLMQWCYSNFSSIVDSKNCPNRGGIRRKIEWIRVYAWYSVLPLKLVYLGWSLRKAEGPDKTNSQSIKPLQKTNYFFKPGKNMSVFCICESRCVY